MQDSQPMRQAGAVPTLTAYLHEKYTAGLAARRDQALADFGPAPNAKAAKGHAKACDAIRATYEPTLTDFLAFCDDYMAKLPVSNTLYLDYGLGVRFVNGDVASLAAPQSGAMTRDTSIPITRSQDIPGLHGVLPSQSIEILGRR